MKSLCNFCLGQKSLQIGRRLALVMLLGISFWPGWSQTIVSGFQFATINSPIIRSMKTDTYGFVYVTGTYLASETYDFDPYGTKTSRSDAGSVRDVFVAKYDAGGVLQWVHFGLNENASFLDVQDLELDASGNAYISGYVTGPNARFYDDTGDYEVLGQQISGTDYSGAYVIQFESDGAINWIWNKRYTDTGASYKANNLEITGTDIYIAGSMANSAFIAHLNTSGTELGFQSLGTGDIRVVDMKRDNSGNFHLTGSIHGTVNFGGGNISANSIGNAFVAKYNSSYALQYGKKLTTSAVYKEEGKRLVVSGTESVLVYNPISTNYTKVLRLNASGNTMVEKTWQADYTFTSNDMILDDQSQLILSCFVKGATYADPDSNTVPIGSNQDGQNLILALDLSLDYQWHKNITNTSLLRKQGAVAQNAFGNYLWGYSMDMVGNGFANISVLTTENDSQIPTISALSPADGASGVGTDANLSITFSENVTASSGGTIKIYSGDGVLRETITMPSALVTVNNQTVTINPANDFPSLKYDYNYYILISGGAFRDAAGNPSAPITNNSSWNFLIAGDNTAPTVTSVSPANGATGVAVASNLVLTFSENVEEITGGQIELKKYTDNSVVETFTLPSAKVSTSGNTATINPTNDLAGNTKFYVTVANSTFKDLAGNSMTGNQTNSFWSFTSVVPPDVTGPVVSNLSPASGSSQAFPTSNLVITFDESVTAVSSKTISIYQNKTLFETITLPSAQVKLKSNIASINPNTDFTVGLDYNVRIEAGAFEDASGNDFAGFSTSSDWNFSVVSSDVIAPVALSHTPITGALQVSRSTDLTIAYSEAVSIGSGKHLYIKRYDTDELVQTLTAPTGFSISGSDLTISPSQLPAGTKLYITTESGLVVDGGSNPVAAITDKNDWYFTTVDDVNPVISALSPAAGASGVNQSVSATITFSEPIYTLSGGTLTIFRYDNDQQVMNTDLINQNQGGNTYSFNVPTTLAYGKKFYVLISNAAFQDAAGNLFAGISNKDTWTFTIETAVGYESDPPVISSLYPANGAVDVNRRPGLNYNFNETVHAPQAATAELRKYATDEVIWTFDISAGYYSANQSLAEQMPIWLDGDVKYYIHMDAGVFIDAWENEFAGFTSKDDWAFTTRVADVTAPAISSISPQNGKLSQYLYQANFQISFNENIRLNEQSEGKVSIFKADHSIFAEYEVGDLNIPEGGSVLNIPLISPFEPSTDYYITMDEDMIIDAEFNGFEGWTDETTWTFTTETFESAMSLVESFQPARGASGVSSALDKIVITINVSAYDNDGYIRLRKVADQSIVKEWLIYDAEIDYDNNIFSFPLDGTTLELGASYYVEHTANDPDEFSIGVIGMTVGDDETEIYLAPWADDFWSFSVESNPTVTWNGTAWSNGSGPQETDDVVMQGYFLGAFRCNNLTIQSGGDININGLLYVAGNIENNGDLFLQSGSSMISFASGEFTGYDMIMNRETRYENKYSFVGSPMQASANSVGSSIGSVVYQYNETKPYGANEGLSRWENALNQQLQPGRGYAQSGRMTLGFVGKPNTGTITFAGTYTEDTNDANEGWNLIANPYPAAISVEDFLAENTNLTGAVYLWDDNGSDQTRGNNSDYIVANALAATQNSRAGNGSRYNQHLGAAQGFFVKLQSASDTEIAFTENMRSEGDNGDGHFFRQTETPIIRVNLTNADGLFKQTVIGQVEGISDDQWNRPFDAEVFGGQSSDGLYSLKMGKLLAIQGATENKEQFPLGYHVAASGTYSLSVELEHFPTQDLYLIDGLTGEKFDLSTGEYTFSSQAGSFMNRFTLVSARQILSAELFKTEIFSFGKTVYFRQQGVAEYAVYHLSGKLMSRLHINGSQQVSLDHLPAGVYVISSGELTQKVILK